MKVAAVMMVRDEADILPMNVAFHRAAGVDEFLIVDNGSVDATPRLLRNLSRNDRSVSWTRNSGPFQQAEITTELVREAVRGGADWVLAIDADEFWLPQRQFGSLLESATAPQVSVEMVTLIQRRDQLLPSLSGLLSMTRRVATPAGPPELAQALVTSGAVAYVESSYTPKVIHRASADVVVQTGNHNFPGAFAGAVGTDQVVCMHLPLRARSILDAKVELERRLEDGGFGMGEAWQWRRWRQLAELGELDLEWTANSYAGNVLGVDRGLRGLVIDTRLRDALIPLIGFFRAA
jgi:hypothetical protein